MRLAKLLTQLGTAEGGEMKAPTEKTVFEEDLTPEERAKLYKEKAVVTMIAAVCLYVLFSRDLSRKPSSLRERAPKNRKYSRSGCTTSGTRAT